MIFKRKNKRLTLDDISVFTFKNCLKGDLSGLNGNTNAWGHILELYEKNTIVKARNIQLELRKRIFIKENEINLFNTFLFVIKHAFKSFLYSGNMYYLNIIEENAKKLNRYGFKFDVTKDIIKEHNRIIKQVKNKQHQIREYLNTLKESEKGGIEFNQLVAIVGKFSGGGIINQKNTTMGEFVEFYKLMLSNGK